MQQMTWKDLNVHQIMPNCTINLTKSKAGMDHMERLLYYVLLYLVSIRASLVLTGSLLLMGKNISIILVTFLKFWKILKLLSELLNK